MSSTVISNSFPSESLCVAVSASPSRNTSGRSMPASEAKELSCNPGNEPSEFELGHFGTDGTCPITLPKPPLPPLPTLQKLAPLARRSWLQSPVGPCSARCMASMLDLGDNASRLPCGSLCFLSCELKLPNVLKVPEPIGESNEPDAPNSEPLHPAPFSSPSMRGLKCVCDASTSPSPPPGREFPPSASDAREVDGPAEFGSDPAGVVIVGVALSCPPVSSCDELAVCSSDNSIPTCESNARPIASRIRCRLPDSRDANRSARPHALNQC
mmetsp:Transcript_17139/g.40191  ORF Transcript_17139/g.40191 Transcript_17139/m.40191 type:complete len:270 (+) Transcript_17139:339-1148(+)